MTEHEHYWICKKARAAAEARRKPLEIEMFTNDCRDGAIERLDRKAEKDPLFRQRYPDPGEECPAYIPPMVRFAAGDVERDWQRRRSRMDSSEELKECEDQRDMHLSAAVRHAFSKMKPVEQNVIATMQEVDWDYAPFPRETRRLQKQDLSAAIPAERDRWAPSDDRSKRLAPNFEDCKTSFKRLYLED